MNWLYINDTKKHSHLGLWIIDAKDTNMNITPSLRGSCGNSIFIYRQHSDDQTRVIKGQC